MAIAAVVCCATTAGAAEAYVRSVPLPTEPSEPQASTLYYRDGRTILARVGTTNRNDVPLSAVPEEVRHAVLAAEDRDFYDHHGVSVRGVLRAVVANVSGGRQGASTITQQYARNAFLTQEVSVERKGKEFALAVQLEREYSKDEILERYLNTIYYGRGAYGIAAAAYAYFGVAPERLTAAQGAVLAAVIRDPYQLDPANDSQAARARWNWVIESERDLGWLDAVPEYPVVSPVAPRETGANGLVIDRVEQELAAHGITSRALHTQGLSVVTTLDPVAQEAAVSQVAGHLAGQPKDLQVALVAVDPGSGGVRAYYGGDQGRGFFDYASAAYPAASTFKPIVLAAALREGIGYLSRWDGTSPRTFTGRLGVPLENPANQQCPDCTLEQAMVKSLNTPFYAVTEKIGADRVRAMAYDLGVQRKYAGTRSLVDAEGEPMPGKTRSDIALGRYPVAPDDLASVYATFAAGGVRHDRHFVENVSAPDGRQVWNVVPASKRVLDSSAAADVSAVLGAVVRGDGAVPNRPAAGKTGVQQWGDTHDNQVAWMVGYTPELASAVWIGKARPGPIRDRLGRAIEGRTMPAQLWRDFTQVALNDRPKTALPKPVHVGRTDVGDAGRSKKTGKSTGGVKDADTKPGRGIPVVRTAGKGQRLALTFDDGPSPYTAQVLDLLAEQQVRATFCVVGEEVQKYPDLVRRIVAEGHVLCNHSWKHDDLGQLSASAAKADIARTDAAIAAAVPGVTVPFFRAPFGSWGRSAMAGTDLGHTPLGWVVDPDDWLLPGADVIADRIEKQLQPRAVVLVHDGGGERDQTVAALTRLIPKLKSKGWTFDLPERTVRSEPLPTAPVKPTPSGSPSPSPSPSATSAPSPSGSVKPSGSGKSRRPSTTSTSAG
ncbi:transglycosylase domain-containing protein [Actinoplanes flavus]|uniref:transglycosylase domain-containing protein n=1 Tax=Actinoplanes flavus TaxID=2820290 RepID=UPI0027DBEBB1|nr:transglycosylase domain-containing protein [Actinoplanes flavus]